MKATMEERLKELSAKKRLCTHHLSVECVDREGNLCGHISRCSTGCPKDVYIAGIIQAEGWAYVEDEDKKFYVAE